MRKRVSVRPTKATSIISMIFGIIFCVIGLVIVIPIFGLFGILWTVVAFVMTASFAYNVFSEKGFATSRIDIEDVEMDQRDSHTIEDKLVQLNVLYEKRLITQEEFDKKKIDLLNQM